MKFKLGFFAIAIGVAVSTYGQEGAKAHAPTSGVATAVSTQEQIQAAQKSFEAVEKSLAETKMSELDAKLFKKFLGEHEGFFVVSCVRKKNLTVSTTADPSEPTFLEYQATLHRVSADAPNTPDKVVLFPIAPQDPFLSRSEEASLRDARKEKLRVDLRTNSVRSDAFDSNVVEDAGAWSVKIGDDGGLEERTYRFVMNARGDAFIQIQDFGLGNEPIHTTLCKMSAGSPLPAFGTSVTMELETKDGALIKVYDDVAGSTVKVGIQTKKTGDLGTSKLELKPLSPYQIQMTGQVMGQPVDWKIISSSQKDGLVMSEPGKGRPTLLRISHGENGKGSLVGMLDGEDGTSLQYQIADGKLALNGFLHPEHPMAVEISLNEKEFEAFRENPSTLWTRLAAIAAAAGPLHGPDKEKLDESEKNVEVMMRAYSQIKVDLDADLQKHRSVAKAVIQEHRDLIRKVAKDLETKGLTKEYGAELEPYIKKHDEFVTQALQNKALSREYLDEHFPLLSEDEQAGMFVVAKAAPAPPESAPKLAAGSRVANTVETKAGQFLYGTAREVFADGGVSVQWDGDSRTVIWESSDLETGVREKNGIRSGDRVVLRNRAGDENFHAGTVNEVFHKGGASVKFDDIKFGDRVTASLLAKAVKKDSSTGIVPGDRVIMNRPCQAGYISTGSVREIFENGHLSILFDGDSKPTLSWYSSDVGKLVKEKGGFKSGMRVITKYPPKDSTARLLGRVMEVYSDGQVTVQFDGNSYVTKGWTTSNLSIAK